MPKVKYVACFNCGHARALTLFNREPFNIPPAKFYILQVREQKGGRSKEAGQRPGFYLVPEECKTMVTLYESDNAEERELAQALKDRLITIVKAYKDVGILTDDEL